MSNYLVQKKHDDIEMITDIDHNQVVPPKVRLQIFFPTSDSPATNCVQQLAFIAYRLLPKEEERSVW
jgi:hypothetical protein